MSTHGSTPRDALVLTLRSALTCPASLDSAGLGGLADALRLARDDVELGNLALAALAGVLYSRPDLADDAIVDRLADLATAPSLAEGVESSVVRLFEGLASSPAAPRAWARLSAVLPDARTPPNVRQRLLRLVGEFVRWREDLVGLEGILGLAESPALADRRALLLDHGVERFVFCAPESFTIERLERIVTLFEHAPRYRYALYSLAARRTLAAGVRAFLARQLDGRFPLQQTAAAILVDRPVRLLVAMNIALGQGDEIVRLVPLLQPLLDANPELAITLIARRTYLYDCPRVTTVPIGDDAAVQAALAGSFDGVIEIFQPDRVEFAHRFELHDAIERLLVEQRPAFVVRAELGRAEKGDLAVRSEFLYQTVELGGRDVARSCRLDRIALRNIYEPCLRLLAELGLPPRAAEEAPATPSLLTGAGSAEAERVWRDLVSPEAAASRRAVALVNPFGGAGPTKGFLDQGEILAAHIGGLVDEGYLVVVLPNGTPWGRRAAVLDVLSHLEPDVRASVRVAPDPAESEAGAMLDLTEKPDLAYADRVMRLFKYFTAYADLVVTVEGWMSHLAYNLGRPMRLFLAAGSFTPDWFPHGRGGRQRLVTAFSPRSRVPRGETALLGDGDPPPLPHHRGRPLLEIAIAGLGRYGDTDAVAPLRRALASPDSDLRRCAVAALRRFAAGAAKHDLLAALADDVPTVIREAAETLLLADVDCSRELGARYRDVLRVHAAIVRHDWDAVRRLGPAAFPVLFRVARSGNYVLAKESRSLLRQMLAPYVPGLPSEAPSRVRKEPRARRGALAGVLRSALTSPTSLLLDGLEHLGSSLRLDPNDPEECELALAATAAVLYSRPELLDSALVDRLADLLAGGPVPDGVRSAAVKLLELLASSPLAARVWTRLAGMLPDENLDETTRERLLSVLREVVDWREDLVGLDGILNLAESPALEGHRAFLLDQGIERFVFCAPESFTVERLERVAALFEDTPRYRYVLYFLAARRTLAPEARAFIDRRLAGHFPLHEPVAALFTRRPVSLLAVLNVGQGQGDDVVRLAPLLQGLLDANPALRITLVTFRPYLYDNPRVTTIPIGDEAALQAALTERFDGVIEFFQPEAPDFTFRLEAHSSVERYLAERRTAFVIKGDLGRVCEGRAGNRSPFLHQTVELEGQDFARARGLDEKALGSIYDPSMRLLAELGLPQRAGEEAPLTPSLLAGVRSADAERLWAELLACEPGAVRHPVVLLNPFGGSGPTKGFLDQDALLAAEISGLVDEGFLVVVLPGGHPWARPSIVLGVLSHLPSDRRARVRVAPDPAEPDEALRLELPERPNLSYADRVMRAFKYFGTYADLIVTVEGWLAHFAYNLGRPFRLLPAAGSFCSDWYPRGRGPAQRLVAVLSPRARPAYGDSDLLAEGDPPPLAHRPRKFLLELALAGLGRHGGAASVAPLRRALASPDPDVRTWAVAALGRVAPLDDRKADLLAALQDRWTPVAREAADALLREGVDCRRELGPRYRELLQAEADIARQQWEAAAGVGPAVLPALFRATRSELHDVRAGAKELLRRMLPPFVPRLRPPDGACPTGPSNSWR